MSLASGLPNKSDGSPKRESSSLRPRNVAYKNIVDAIGNTPLIELSELSPKPSVKIFAKLEGQNPTGSVKDRIAKFMLEDALESGALKPGQTILESTSGNTGIALAMIGRRLGFNLKAVMPENVSEERVKLLKIFGAEIIYSPGDQGTNGAVVVANKIAEEDKEGKYFAPYQYGNPANPRAHYEGTAVEIIEALPEITHFVAGLGTGGTLTGNGRRLKEHNPDCQVIAVEPHPGENVAGLRSIDEGFIPPVLDQTVLDRRFVVESRQAFCATQMLTEKEGVFAGISSGAVVHTALMLAQRLDKGNIVILFPDGGWKYMSTDLWTTDLTKLENLENMMWW